LEPVSYTKSFVALLFVLGLIGVLAITLRYVKERRMPQWGKAKDRRRLQLQETLLLDGRYKVVIFRKDDQEYSWLLGPDRAHAIDMPEDRDVA